MSLVEVLKIIVLGIVEGFTEWLPISSTGHMILVDEIIRLNQPDAFKDVFLVVIQLGAILAVVVMFFHKLNPFSPSKSSPALDIKAFMPLRMTRDKYPQHSTPIPMYRAKDCT